MSSDGENILKLFRQARQVCEQVSLLLRTADEQMLKEGWKSEGNNAISDISYSLLNPSQWIPIVAFRFYKHKNYSNRLSYISVLMCDHFDRRYTIEEPFVTAGFFDYGIAEVKDDWEYWYARYYGYLSKDHSLRADGKTFRFDKKMLSTDVQGKFEKGIIFALPLTSILNARDVGLQVTDRLLGLLKE